MGIDYPDLPKEGIYPQLSYIFQYLHPYHEVVSKLSSRGDQIKYQELIPVLTALNRAGDATTGGVPKNKRPASLV